MNTELEITTLYSDMAITWGREPLEDEITACLEANSHWLSGLDVLLYCRNTEADSLVSACAKMRSKLKLSHALPLTLADSGPMALEHALKLLGWLMSGDGYTRAICILTDGECNDASSVSASRRNRISILEIRTKNGAGNP
ncbi:hypothetical protein [Paenibacillus sp. LPE1-1-1.1]|uniref:hypothetical protein n=1 Tax=Paenibacillus sp. LPE1-1-1.1 TaxID=3135230 RepID=UPI00341F93FC